MARINISGGAYQARSIPAAAQRCLNLYPEPIPQQEQEPAQFFHYPTPGQKTFCCPEVGAVRCLYQTTQGDLIAAVGSGIYLIGIGGDAIKIGMISPGSNQVRMQDNGITLFIVDGSTSGGWYCSLPAKPQSGSYGPLSRVIDNAFYGSRTIAVLDTFFLYTNPDTTNWYVGPAEFSDEATTPFDSTYVASKTSYPDTIVGIAVVGQTIWLFGSQETELWYTSGAADFPFQRLPSLSIGSGCVAPYSISANSDVVMWLGQDKAGLPRVYMGAGQGAQSVSNFAIESAIQGYADSSDAIGNIYQQAGHTFYVLTFPQAGKTWVYDLSTSLWHERCSLASDGKTEICLRANAWACAYGKVFCGDPKNGAIYEVLLDLDTDSGLPIKRQRSFPHAIGDGRRMIHRKLMLDMQNGSGVTVNVDWSDDRGQTFCAPIALQLGLSGNVWPTIWRLGIARDRVYRLTWYSGNGAALMGVFLDADTVAT